MFNSSQTAECAECAECAVAELGVEAFAYSTSKNTRMEPPHLAPQDGNLLAQLKVLAQIRVGDKLETRSQCIAIDAPALFRGARRWVHGEDRLHTVAAVVEVVSRAILRMQQCTPEVRSHAWLRPLYVKDLQHAQAGLLNLQLTYTRCPQTVAQFQVLSQSIDASLADASAASLGNSSRNSSGGGAHAATSSRNASRSTPTGAFIDTACGFAGRTQTSLSVGNAPIHQHCSVVDAPARAAIQTADAPPPPRPRSAGARPVEPRHAPTRDTCSDSASPVAARGPPQNTMETSSDFDSVSEFDSDCTSQDDDDVDDVDDDDYNAANTPAPFVPHGKES